MSERPETPLRRILKDLSEFLPAPPPLPPIPKRMAKELGLLRGDEDPLIEPRRVFDMLRELPARGPVRLINRMVKHIEYKDYVREAP